jgi:hypothetical protein
MGQDSLLKIRKMIVFKHGGLRATDTASYRSALRASLWFALEIDAMDAQAFPAGTEVPS